ncbi:MFS transporter [Nocardiopsis sp. RSe5-2]|uniref:MFS transporter n=1 Tax=Nocardiopsis endophytica TaxID=3018445 RepID=A0ABT4U370_9ACTN|nr:MFS transporter [Nocardiopsis endophytica]MDA2811403.1 MFS transporter [Nocardiopsis endophytica]
MRTRPGPMSPHSPDRRRIGHWNPEDEGFWRSTGRAVALRNLRASVFAEHLAFSVWGMWSVLLLFMTPERGFGLAPSQGFLLVSIVTVTGAALRVPYTLAAARFGGRTWTLAAVAVLLVPASLAAVLVDRPGTPFWLLCLLAATAGLGGANFSSSTANIDRFFPGREKGWALGANAGGGNLGVPAVQLLGLATAAVLGQEHGRVLPLIYVPLLLAALWTVRRSMDDLPAPRAAAAPRSAVLADRDFWRLSLLYTGTFGSFIGFSFAFGLLLQSTFGRTPAEAAAVAFVGPLLGSLARPLGGLLADRCGGGAATAWLFAAMAAGTGLILAASAAGAPAAFIAGFVALFLLSGLGNGAVFTLIPSVFAARPAAGPDGGGLSGTALGLTGAIGALGGALVNLVLYRSFAATGGAEHAYAAFIALYAVCIAVTVRHYLRPRAPHREAADR